MAEQAPGARVIAQGWGFRHAGRREWALRHVDLRIEPGERVLLLGRSGAGKSTLLKALAGLLDAEHSGQPEGRLDVDGHDPRLSRRRSGLLMQDPSANVVMATVGDDVAFGLENRAFDPSLIWPRVDESLAAASLHYGRARGTDQLSGGELQRLALAGVLAHRPGLLLLDEPTANLDPAQAAAMRAVIADVLDRTGATLVMVEHRVSECLDLVDRVVLLEAGGGVVANGPPHQVFAERGVELAQAGVWSPNVALPEWPRVTVGSTLLTLDEVSVTGRLAATSTQAGAGQVVAITGPSGAGKSTLVLIAAGLTPPESGSVRATATLGGQDEPPHRWPARDLVRRIGTVFQNPEHQLTTSRVADELALGPRLTGQPSHVISARVDELLQRLHLEHLAQANPYTLSGGEKRRLSVATALATDPPLLVLDEPTFGQDRVTWIELAALLAERRDSGGAALIATHDLDFVRALQADSVVLRPVGLSDAGSARP